MRRRHASDEGATLIVALILVVAVSLSITALLSLTQTGELTTVAYRGQAGDVYAAGAGIDGAINDLASKTTKGTTGSGSDCGNYSFSLPNTNLGIDEKSVQVTCQPTSDSGTGGSSGGGGSTNSSNTPENAVLTLPDTGVGETGIHVASNTSTSLKMRGGVFTNGAISISNGSTLFDCAATNSACDTADGTVKAIRTCDFNQIQAGTVACSNTTPVIADGQASDPGVGNNDYGLPSVADGFDPSQGPSGVPSCTASKVVSFSPGNYTDASALTALMSGGCSGAVFYFSPGYYYFDFGNTGSHDWTINDPNADVIGGQVKGTSAGSNIWDPTSTNARSNVPSPRQCASDDDNALTDSGVEFIFGGDSQLSVNADQSMDLCPIVDSSHQEISIYGVKSGSHATDSKTFDTATSVTTGNSAPKFTNLDGAKAIDSATADATLVKNQDATITISGWSDSVPSQAIVNSATITVARYEENTSNQSANVTLASSISSSGGSQTLNLTTSTSSGNQNKDLTVPTSLVATAAKRASLAFQLTATLHGNNGANEHINGVKLVINYTLPGLNGESGCVTTTPYPTAGCPLLQTNGNPANITIHGTIYAPKAALDVQMPNQVNQFFGRGLVARTLQINPTASNPLGAPTFDLPQASSGGGPTSPSPRKVVLTAYVDGVVRLRAFVKFSDLTSNCSNVTDCNGPHATVINWSYVR